MSEALTLGKNLHDNGFGMFRTQLSHKLERKGSVLIKIDRWYPSSKLCHVCGYKNTNLKLSDREWECPECHTLLDRDENAAINIREEGKRIFFEYFSKVLEDKEAAAKRAQTRTEWRKNKNKSA